MTEQEWLTSDRPGVLEEILKERGELESWRKKRLFCVECCRRQLSARPDWPRRQLSEKFAAWAEDATHPWPQDLNSDEDWILTDPGDREGLWAPGEFDLDDRSLRATCKPVVSLAEVALLALLFSNYDLFPESEYQCNLIRDIFGNPFRSIDFDPSWRTSTAVSIAKGMYESRDFAPMPLLADALEDAGCNHADILDHCRDAGPHVRGCWVVDLVLGKNVMPPGIDFF